MNWDYLAGFFDGEGTPGIERAKQPYLSIPQKQLQVLEAIRDFLLSQGVEKVDIRHRPHISTRGEHHELRVRRKGDVLKVLEVLTPMLLVKRTDAERVLAFIQAKS